jgi:hypothetical protein
MFCGRDRYGTRPRFPATIAQIAALGPEDDVPVARYIDNEWGAVLWLSGDRYESEDGEVEEDLEQYIDVVRRRPDGSWGEGTDSGGSSWPSFLLVITPAGKDVYPSGFSVSTDASTHFVSGLAGLLGAVLHPRDESRVVEAPLGLFVARTESSFPAKPPFP